MPKYIRIKYKIENNARYISHLDTIRMFQRMFRRADFPVTYSCGFNPHPEFVIGLPRPVGTTGLAEYCDIKTDKPVSAKEWITRFNTQLPTGVTVIDGKSFDSAVNIMAEIKYLAASCDFTGTPIEFSDLSNLMNENELYIDKQSKKGRQKVLKKVNIKPMLHYIGMGGTAVFTDDCRNSEFEELVYRSNRFGNKAVTILCSAGSGENLKPELFIKALSEKTGISEKHIPITRLEMYTVRDGKQVNPLEVLTSETTR